MYCLHKNTSTPALDAPQNALLLPAYVAININCPLSSSPVLGRTCTLNCDILECHVSLNESQSHFASILAHHVNGFSVHTRIYYSQSLLTNAGSMEEKAANRK